MPAETDGFLRVSLVGPRSSAFEAAAGSAISLAAQRLASPRCQQVFSDFHDGAGRTLLSNLELSGYTGSGFLEILRFANGERYDRCQGPHTVAATAPNSHVILFCGQRFSETQRQQPELAAAVVIHEMLHSLGLRENPPTSSEITARVLQRCAP